jgi:anti-sigma factor RsiW
MNDVILDRLMLDAALGELDEDVLELLMAQLEGDSQKTREVEELGKLVGEARRAMKEECPVEPELREMPRLRINPIMTWSGRIAAMAACLVIGFAIARMRPAKQVEIVVRERAAVPAIVAVNDVKPAPEGELWSAQRIYRNALEVNRNEKPKPTAKRILQ